MRAVLRKKIDWTIIDVSFISVLHTLILFYPSPAEPGFTLPLQTVPTDLELQCLSSRM